MLKHSYVFLTQTHRCYHLRYILLGRDQCHLKASNAIWCHGISSVQIQLMASCLIPPCHYLNHCWLIRYCGIQLGSVWHRVLKVSNPEIELENYMFSITAKTPRGQWVTSPLGDDPDSCYHMASLAYNELTSWELNKHRAHNWQKIGIFISQKKAFILSSSKFQ